MTNQTDRRWFCVEMTLPGKGRFFVGRVESSAAELRAEFGPYAEINAANGECHVWGRKPRRA